MKYKFSPPCGALVLLYLVTSISFVFITDGSAAAQDRRDYIGLSFNVSRGEIDGIITTGFTNLLNVRKHFDVSADLGLIRGYRWKNIPFHTEIEISHRLRYDVDVRDEVQNGLPSEANPNVGWEMNVSSTSLLINSAYAFRSDSSLTPYLGGGIGWARNTADTEREALLNRNNPERASFSTNNLVWALILGAIWDWDERWAVDIGYRYKDLGEIETGTLSAQSVKATKFFSHDLSLAVVRRF